MTAMKPKKPAPKPEPEPEPVMKPRAKPRGKKSVESYVISIRLDNDNYSIEAQGDCPENFDEQAFLDHAEEFFQPSEED